MGAAPRPACMRVSARRALPFFALILVVPQAQAGLQTDAPVGDVEVVDDRGTSCGSGPVRACFATVRADAAPGDAEVDAYQRVLYVGAATGDVALLPDESVVLRGSDLVLRHDALRLATAAWNGAPAPRVETAGLDMTPERAALRVRDPASDAPRDRYYGAKYAPEENGVGYDRVGPFHRPTGTETDAYTTQVVAACAPAPGTPCREAAHTSGDAYRDATPNVRFGVEFYDVEVAAGEPQLRRLERLERGLGLATVQRAAAPALSLARAPAAAAPLGEGDAAPAPAAPAPLASPQAGPEAPRATAAGLAPIAAPEAGLLTPARVAAVALGLLVLAAAALYSRFQTQQALLESGSRGRILRIVEARPGVCLSEVAEEMGVTRNAIAHHVRMLHRARLLETVEDDGRRRLYKPGTSVQPGLRVPAAILDHPVRGRIVALVGADPAGVPRRAIHERLHDVPERTRNHAVRRLAVRGILEVVRDPAGEEWLRLAAKA